MELILLVGGAVLGLLLTEGYRYLSGRRAERLAEKRYQEINSSSSLIEDMHAGLALVQAGWDPDGFFHPGSITVRLKGSFKRPEEIDQIRAGHSDEWLRNGHTDGRQVGISSYIVSRVSDHPEQERRGLAHSLVLQAHEFDYFDFLASHRVLLYGSEAEKELLADLVAKATLSTPSPELPTPCSVGLSLVAEGGRTLVLTVRAGGSSPAGAWRGGQVYNAVGEGMAARDFASAGYDAQSCSPDITAARGAYEELGFRPQEMQRSTMRLHSFAFATDILDFKFFGCLETDLSIAEIQGRWEESHDRSEAKGLLLRPIATRAQALDVLREIQSSPQTWAPEARFCTIRTLLCLHKVRLEDVVKVSSTQASP